VLTWGSVNTSPPAQANNPADAAVHEARRLYGADRPLVVVSVGTGSALPRPSDNSYRGYPSWIANIFNATGNVCP